MFNFFKQFFKKPESRNFQRFNQELALHIVEEIQQLKATRVSHIVDDEDVPEGFNKHRDGHARWNAVLDDIIYAFEANTTRHRMSVFKHFTEEGRRLHHERVAKGFRLFAKYYSKLWA